MVLDDALVASGDENQVLNAGLACLVDDILDDRLVDDGQHFLGHGLRRGQEPCTEPRDREHRFSNFLHHCNHAFDSIPDIFTPELRNIEQKS